MSRDTRTALEDAIRAHIADETDGAYLTDWVLTTAAVLDDDPNAHVYTTETSHSAVHVRLGLVRYAAIMADRLVPPDEDD
jgi:hypothetical protein